jgi:hypothetical protein
MGAPGTPMDVYVRLLFLKFRYGLSYEEVDQEVRERIPYRFFCHLSLMDDVPDSTTLIKLNQRLGEERIRQLNKRLVKFLVKMRKIKPRRIRIDSTTLETHISYPTDLGLLHQMVTTLTPQGQEGWAEDYRPRPLHQTSSGADGSRPEVKEQDWQTTDTENPPLGCEGGSRHRWAVRKRR